jgi:hypothetical protein
MKPDLLQPDRAAPLSSRDQMLVRFLEAPYALVVPTLLAALAAIYFAFAHDPDRAYVR